MNMVKKAFVARMLTNPLVLGGGVATGVGMLGLGPGNTPEDKARQRAGMYAVGGGIGSMSLGTAYGVVDPIRRVQNLGNSMIRNTFSGGIPNFRAQVSAPAIQHAGLFTKVKPYLGLMRRLLLRR